MQHGKQGSLNRRGDHDDDMARVKFAIAGGVVVGLTFFIVEIAQDRYEEWRLDRLAATGAAE